MTITQTVAETKPVDRPQPEPTLTKVTEAELLPLAEFNIRFLLRCSEYRGDEALDIIRDCRNDLQVLGVEATIAKWGRFVEGGKDGQRN